MVFFLNHQHGTLMKLLQLDTCYKPFGCMFTKWLHKILNLLFFFFFLNLIYMRDSVFIPKKIVYDVHRNKHKERNICECHLFVRVFQCFSTH